MSFLTKAAGTILSLIVVTGFAGAAFAAPVTQQLIEEHYQLVRTVQNAGTSVFVNHPQCNEVDAHGFYSSGANVIVICQDNGKGDGKIAEWTSNDLDTIRHEIHHLIQDCNGRPNDGVLDNLLSPEELQQFAKDAGLTQETIKRIIFTYRSLGASDAVVMNEIEAFAVARAVDPLTIADVVNRACVR